MKQFALSIWALVVGIATACVLVAAYTYFAGRQASIAARANGGDLLMPLDDQVGFAFFISLVYAVIAAACCAPIWLFLKSTKLANAWSAIILGVVAPMTLWILDNLSGEYDLPALIVSGFPYAACGAAAGLATWVASPRTQRNGS